MTKTASVATAVAGNTIVYRIEVRVKNFASTSGVTRAVVTDTLPAGVSLLSTKVNRGPGCTGTTTITCDMDFLAGQLVATIDIAVRVTTTGTLVNTASVKAPEFDPDMSNNTASVTVTAPQAPPPPPPPPSGVAAPKLTHSRPATAKTLVAARSGLLASVATLVAVDKQAIVRLVVRDSLTGKQLTLQPGSKLATTTLKRKAAAARTTVALARTFSLKAVLRGLQLHRGGIYQLVLTATGTTGKTSTLKIRFLA